MESFVKGVNKEEFKQNSMIRSAVTKKLENIGEAARHLPQDFKDKNSHIPWRDAADMRNFLIHEYFGIDENELWRTVVEDIPLFKENIKKLLK